KDMDDNFVFPKQGIHRYEQLKRDLITPKGSYEHIIQQIKEMNDDIAQKESESIDPNMYEEAKQLVHKKNQYEQLQDELQKVQMETEWLQDEIQETVNEMDMPIEMIEDKHYPLALQQEWLTIGNEHDRINKEKLRLQAEQQAWMEEQDQLNEEIEQIEVNLYPDTTFQEMQEQLTLDDNDKAYAKQQASWTQFKQGRHQLAKKTLWVLSVI